MNPIREQTDKLPNEEPSEQSGEQQGSTTPKQDQRKPSLAKAADYLANERTLLAWVRTCIALIGLGFVVARFSLFLRQLAVQNSQVAQGLLGGQRASIIGTIIVGLAALLLGLSYLRYRAAAQALDRGRYDDRRGLAVGVVAVVILIAIALIVYLVITS